MKRIIFNLENRKNHWYDKIASGEKTVEYRRVCDYWRKRVWFKRGALNGYLMFPNNDRFAVFRLGYSRKHPDIVRRITKIDIGTCPYEGWDGEYFRIHFEKEAANGND